MNPNCVNILNKTVFEVCKLENQVYQNTSDIEFILKFLNFNKNLLLSQSGSQVSISSFLTQFHIDLSFSKDCLIKKFIIGILNHLNENNKENYYLLIESYNDIPRDFRNLDIKVPSIIQISLVQPEQSELVSLLDSIKNGDLGKLSPIINKLSELFNDINSFTLAILQFLIKSPEITYFKENKINLSGKYISKSYDELNSCKINNTLKISNLFFKNIQIKNVLDTTNLYIQKGYEQVQINFKEKSFNDPFFPQPNPTDYLIQALNKFLSDHNLGINNNGTIYNISSQPFEPFEPYQPAEPYQPSEPNFSIPVKSIKISDEENTNMSTKIITSTLNNDAQSKIELKIKELLELTESSYTNTDL